MRLINKKYFNHKGLVYDISVNSKDKSYSVNNIVVHNSSAGSLVAYLMDITKIDPIQWNLLFERFLNSGRMGDLVDCKAFEIDTNEGIFIANEKSLIRVVRDNKELSIHAENLLQSDEILKFE